MNYQATLDRRSTLRLIGASCIITALKGCTVADIFNEAGVGFTFDLSDPQFAPLHEVGQMVGFDTGGREVLLIRRNEEEIIALNRKCTHQGFDLAPDKFGLWNNDQLTCKQHFSIFDHTGAVVSGLADRPLQSYGVSFDQSAGTGEVDFLTSGGSGGDTGGQVEEMAGDMAGSDGGKAGGGMMEGGVMGGSLGDVPAEYRDLENPFRNDPDAASRGEADYVNCIGCHGAEGVGGPTLMPPASAFNVDQSEWTDGYLFWRIKEGGVGESSMPAFGTFMTDDQMWQLVSYIRSLGI